MQRWGMALAIMAGCWWGVLWPVLVCLLLALAAGRGRASAWLWMPVACLYGVWQMQTGLAQRLPD
ncbi:MAG: hypothetical protein ACPH3N_15075, partial [Alcanivorax sediminis]